MIRLKPRYRQLHTTRSLPNITVFVCLARIREIWLCGLALAIASVICWCIVLLTRPELMEIADLRNLRNLEVQMSDNIVPITNEIPSTPAMPGTVDFLGTYGEAEIDFLHVPRDARCRTNTSKAVSIFVMSSPEDVLIRERIRAAWPTMPISQPNFGVTFVLGIPSNSSTQTFVDIESLNHGDILQAKFFDSYTNLPWKTYSMLLFVRDNCNKKSMIYKVDADTMVFPKGVEWLRNLSANSSAKNFIVGFVSSTSKPHRNVTSKWYISRDVFNGTIYPRFTSGPGYVMSGDVPDRLIKAAHDMKPNFPLEDVLWTGFVAQKANVQRLHSTNFKITGKIIVCNNRQVLQHRWNSRDLHRDWKEYLRLRRIAKCPLEVKEE